MSITIKNINGQVVLHRVAKTSRGFNRKQRREINAVRAALAANPAWVPERKRR